MQCIYRTFYENETVQYPAGHCSLVRPEGVLHTSTSTSKILKSANLLILQIGCYIDPFQSNFKFITNS